jgi:hypothetical protein
MMFESSSSNSTSHSNPVFHSNQYGSAEPAVGLFDPLPDIAHNGISLELFGNHFRRGNELWCDARG